MSALSTCLAESGEVSVGAVGINEPRAGRVRIPRSARQRDDVVSLRPDHDAGS
jgi:hypothetical protein